MEFPVPEPNDVLARMADVRARLGGNEWSIAEWRARYREELAANRSQSDIGIFNRFVNSLLERAMLGEAWFRRARVLQQVFVSYDAVTEESAREVLRTSGYRWGPEKGAAVIVAAKGIVTRGGFTWEQHIRRAEDRYESDFQDDAFLSIANVNFKTRDLALSELSDRFVAIDLHVVRVTSRTGLLLHGYGDPWITTDVSKSDGQGYLFFHDLILKLARRTGWPAAGHSPGEIDRMFWHFGRAVCKAVPGCQGCPVAGTCLTSLGRDQGRSGDGSARTGEGNHDGSPRAQTTF